MDEMVNEWARFSLDEIQTILSNTPFSRLSHKIAISIRKRLSSSRVIDDAFSIRDLLSVINRILMLLSLRISQIISQKSKAAFNPSTAARHSADKVLLQTLFSFLLCQETMLELPAESLMKIMYAPWEESDGKFPKLASE